jgi:dethiobiotin synthetase
MRIVMLGTGTDVGKTYVTARLAEAMATRRRVLALKPIESGVRAGSLGDAERIALAAGHEPKLSPWRFEPPVSPHLAARQAGQVLEVEQVARWVRAQEADCSPEVTLVETAGGALSPFGAGVTNLDLAVALAPALWILVAPDSLGVLHDVTATLRALPRAPDGVVLSAARAPDASSGTNARELSLLGISQVLGEVSRAGDAAQLADAVLALTSNIGGL